MSLRNQQRYLEQATHLQVLLRSSATGIRKNDEETASAAMTSSLQHCLQLPLLASQGGLTFPAVDRKMLAHDIAYPFQRRTGEVRTWHVWVDRLSILFSRLLAKLVYQLKALTASLDHAFLHGSGSQVFWGGREVLEPTPTWRWPNFDSRKTPSEGISPFAIAFLISNRTSREELEAAWSVGISLSQASDLQILFLEDSIREAWVTNYRPVHAGDLAQRVRKEGVERLEVFWRRHQATLASTIVASEHFGEKLGDSRDSLNLACVDVRTGGAKSVADLAKRLLQWAEGTSSARSTSSGRMSFYKLGSSSSFHEHQGPLPAWRGRRGSLADPGNQLFLEPYLDFHRRVVHASHEDSKAFRALVYVCNPLTLCGGHGDRTNGIISAFILALLTSRAFFIDFDSPLPLSLLLQPRKQQDGLPVLDWRLHSLGSIGQGAHSFYLDDRISFQEDLTWLLEDPSHILHVSMNHRELKAMLALH